MEMKIPAIAITAVVIVIVLAGVLMPVLDDATATEKTIRNDGYMRMSHYTNDDDGTFVITWSISDPDYIYVNDDAVKITAPNESLAFNVSFDSTWLIRGVTPAGSNHLNGLQYYKPTGGVTSGNSLEITCSEGSMSGTVGSTSVSGSYTNLYIPDKDGDYIMKDKNTPARILSDSEIVAFGLTVLNSASSPGGSISPGIGLSISGNMDDGLSYNIWRTSTTSSTVTLLESPAMNYTEDKDLVDVYDLESITATAHVVDDSDETKTADTSITYTYFLVPYEVTAEKVVHFSDNESAIFAAIPIMVIVALLIAVVALVFRGRQF